MRFVSHSTNLARCWCVCLMLERVKNTFYAETVMASHKVICMHAHHLLAILLLFLLFPCTQGAGSIDSCFRRRRSVPMTEDTPAPVLVRFTLSSPAHFYTIEFTPYDAHTCIHMHTPSTTHTHATATSWISLGSGPQWKLWVHGWATLYLPFFFLHNNNIIWQARSVDRTNNMGCCKCSVCRACVSVWVHAWSLIWVFILEYCTS